MALPFDIFALNTMAMSNPALTSFSMNASTRLNAGVITAVKDLTLARIGVTHTATTGTSPTYRVSVQALNSSGQPDGTVLGGGSPASKSFNPTSLGWAAASHNILTLDNTVSISRGVNYGLVVDYVSGTIDGSNFTSFGQTLAAPDNGLPYALDFQASWTKRTGLPLFSYGSLSELYGYPVATSASQTYTSAGTNEYGVCFTLPTTVGSTYKLYGVNVLYSPPTSTGTYAIKLYSGSGAADTSTVQTSTGRVGLVTGSTNRRQVLLFSGTLATLTTGQPYRFAILAETANNNLLYYTDFTNAADVASMTHADAAYWTHRAGGNWTDVTTRLPFIELLISDVTQPSGGGGTASLTSGALVRN